MAPFQHGQLLANPLNKIFERYVSIRFNGLNKFDFDLLLGLVKFGSSQGCFTSIPLNAQ